MTHEPVPRQRKTRVDSTTPKSSAVDHRSSWPTKTLRVTGEGQKFAFEVQSFLNPSPVRDLQEAVGQYEIYRTVLEQTEPERRLSRFRLQNHLTNRLVRDFR